jgi:cullin 1
MFYDFLCSEREGEVIDRVLMKNCLSMLVEVNVNSLDVYISDFEREFLQTTQQYYEQEAQAFICQNTCMDYLRKIEQRLKEEGKHR